MTIGNISYNSNSGYGLQLKQGLQKLKNGRDDLNDLFAVITLMKDGDGSQASHFDYMVSKFGFADNVGAKACYDELSSVLAKLNTDSSVSSVLAAMNQVFAKLG